VDIIGEATHERYLKALQVADGFGADAIFVLVTPQFMTDPDQISALFTNNSFQTKVFPVLLGGEMMESAKICLRKNRIEFFEELSEAVAIL
jgi:acyl-CoA synthetase (NDP forming)